jgi:predicted phage replisome organizer
MANDVKWIRMMVGMFDGMSFKKIKRAKIGGESYRDKLTAVWFELMDFAGKCNHDGAFIGTNEIPFTDLSDIATMIDRDDDELELCMAFFLREGMVTIIDDVYSLTNWAMYQNKDGLDRIREQTRLRVAKHRESKKLLGGSVTGSVTVTQSNATDKEIDIDKDIEKEEDKKSNRENTRTLFQRLRSEYIFSDSMADKMQEWITYKMGRREAYQEVGMKALLRKVENNALTYGEQAVCELIDDSMANGWKGIMFDKLKEKPKHGYQKKTKADEMNDFYRMAADWSESK